MAIFTTETLIMALINLARETDHYFSLSVNKEVYVIWFGAKYIRAADLEQGLARAYRYFVEVAKDQGLSIVEEEDLV